MCNILQSSQSAKVSIQGHPPPNLPDRDLRCILEALGEDALPAAEVGSADCAAIL